MKVTIRNDSNQEVGSFNINPRTFKTGSRGFWGSLKMAEPETGKRYQVHVQMVEIGSRPANGAQRAEEAQAQAALPLG